MKTALLTGGNGNLGRLVADQLIERGVKVVKFDLPGTETETTRPGEQVVTGDMRDSALLGRVLDDTRPDVVYHFASLLSGSSEMDLKVAWDINATASFELLRLSQERRVAQFFFASTTASYGSGLADPLPEDTPQWPENLYGATKIAVERAGFYFKAKHGLDFRCLRFPLVISPFAPKTAVTAYPSHAFRAAVNGEPFTFPVSRGTGMSTIFLDDVVDGIVQFTFAKPSSVKAPAYSLHAYFVSAEQVEAAIRTRYPDFACDYVPVDVVEALLNGWPDVIADDAARRDWGWAPRYDFERSAQRMFELIT